MSKVFHPDVGGSREKFEQIAEAFEVLSDRERRFAYDTLDMSKRELESALDELVQIFAVAYGRGITTEKEIKQFAQQLLDRSRANIKQKITEIETFSTNVYKFVNEANTTSYIMQVAVERARQNLTKLTEEIEDFNKKLKRCDTLESLLRFVDLKSKEPFRTQNFYPNRGASSNSTYATTFTVRY